MQLYPSAIAAAAILPPLVMQEMVAPFAFASLYAATVSSVSPL